VPSCRADDLQECEEKAGGNWSAFMALVGISHALARSLVSVATHDAPGDDASTGNHASVFFAWTLLLAFLSSSKSDSKVQSVLVQHALQHLCRLCRLCVDRDTICSLYVRQD
jgi:hypothetical protein